MLIGGDAYLTLLEGNRVLTFEGRFIRCYDKRGYTRLELEAKGEWAQKYFEYVVSADYGQWLVRVLGLLGDYMSVEAVWWVEFRDHVQKAGIKIVSYRVMSLNRSREWIIRQCAPTLLALRLVDGEAELQDLITQEGSKGKRLEKVMALIDSPMIVDRGG